METTSRSVLWAEVVPIVGGCEEFLHARRQHDRSIPYGMVKNGNFAKFRQEFHGTRIALDSDEE